MLEGMIRERYGETGIQVYNLIDGQRNTDDIMAIAGVSEQELGNILSFMEDKGIIKMKYPKPDEVKSQLTVYLPEKVKQRMNRHNVDWNDIVAKLVSLYIDSLEKASTNVKLLNFFNVSEGKKKTAKKAKKRAKGKANKSKPHKRKAAVKKKKTRR